MNGYETELNLFPTISLPNFYDGESLYSWCARFHQLSCNASPRITSRQLFGHPSSGLRCDFPSPIRNLHNKSRGKLGAIAELITNRTLYGFYRPFLPASRANALASAIEIGGFRNVHSRLGLSASLPEYSGLLKACPSCIHSDLLYSPTSWWRIEHQWPATFICQRHQQPLIYVSPLIKEQSRKDWILPIHIDQDEWEEMPCITLQMLIRMEGISAWAKALASTASLQLESSKLRYCYLLEAKDHGHVAMDGSVRLDQLRDGFIKWIGDCSNWPSLSFVQGVQDVNAGFIGQLIRQYPGIRHPLKHILMLAFLYPNADAFIERYEDVSAAYEAEGESGLMRRLSNVRYELIRLVSEERLSVNSAASKLGVSVTQATKFLNKTNIPYQHRPRIVGTEKEAALDLALRSGRERAEICQEFGIRRAYIKDYLAKHRDLKVYWEKARRTKLITQYRKNFLSLLNANPGVPVKRLKKISGNGIQWLQHHDRRWLEDNLPVLGK